jgi:hypothetical protein
VQFTAEVWWEGGFPMAKEARNLFGAGQNRLCGSLQQIFRNAGPTIVVRARK